MPHIQVIRPSDQPSGQQRLLHILKSALRCSQYETAHWVVAFAQQGPLSKLRAAIGDFQANNGVIDVIFGIDQRGTSTEALQAGLDLFDRCALVHSPGRFLSTFHPKFYCFVGASEALFIIGSHNLTPGGLETNLETSVILEVDRKNEESVFDELFSIWLDADALSLNLTEQLIEELQKRGWIVSEEDRQRRHSAGEQNGESDGTALPFPTVGSHPPEPLPKSAKKKDKAKNGAKSVGIGAKGLAIQIDPHDNGEVFLSKTAVNQDPGFFGFPFTGETVPKFAHNKPYPQREPDPVVDITIYDSSSKVVDRLTGYGLNTVFYDEKGEIRVTISSPVAAKIPSYSIMLMQEADDEVLDYVIDIYAPGSSEYDEFLALCDQKMPSGGKKKARQFGWF